jgi:hypothetical protein
MRIGDYTMLGRFVQSPNADRRRLINCAPWLSEGERVVLVSAAVDNATAPPFVIDRMVIDPEGQKFSYHASGGVLGEEYIATFTVTTSVGQVREDEVRFQVVEVRRG